MGNDCEIFRINKQLCDFSTDGRFFALAHHDKLIIKNATTLDICLTFDFKYTIEGFEWSPRSDYVLCYNIKDCYVQIFSIYYPDWEFKLTEGSSGLENVIWAPDNKHIITVSNFKIQISIWCLESHSVTYIQNLKSSVCNGIQFSPNGKYLALIVNGQGHDDVDVYRTKDWLLSRKLICKGLSSVDGFAWSPSSELVSIWCKISGLAKLIIYSIANENYEGIFQPLDNVYNSTLDELSKKKFNEELRGLETVNWMPNGQFLAVSGHNETVILLSYITWKPLLNIRLKPVIKESDYLIRVFKEIIKVDQKTTSNKMLKGNNTIFIDSGSRYIEEVSNRPVNIPIDENENSLGVSAYSSPIKIMDILEFSFCARYLAIRNRNYLRTLWIWDIRTNAVDVLVLKNIISSVKWNPVDPKLIIFTDSACMFEWNSDNTNCLNTPKGMTMVDARFHPSGNSAILCGYNRAVIYKFDRKT
ncbi:hypothetical protein TKK_0009048 [Trichogramma kaykai]|uniref:Translation initiation factor beta propellor-like domain-containing protein n=1 Tax=Trichogramma kaykai TaxID=54128 RepID=A0ABD2X379_9HYME